MTREDSTELANAILAKAGWFPHPDWGAYVRENLVFGIQPDRLGVHVKDFTKIPPGHPLYSADTPDEPHEAAAWLIARFGANVEAQAQEPVYVQQAYVQQDVREEVRIPSAEAPSGVVDSGADATSEGDAGGTENGPDDRWADLLFAHGPAGESYSDDDEEILDAEFAEDAGDLLALGPPDDNLALGPPDDDEAMIEGGDADFPLLGEPEPEDFTPSEFEEEPLPPQDRFYGLDDLDRRRSLRVGDCVRISLAKQHAIWEASGSSEHEYNGLLGEVMHDTIEGVFRGSQGTYNRFVAVSGFQSQAANVLAVERDKVRYLSDPATTREEIEQFDPERGWP